jgi:UMF1 family MFS transporter
MTPRAPEFLLPPPQQRPELDRDASQHSKASAPSLSPSNEADDEQSLSDDYLEMASDRSPPHYDGEDVRLTSDKELSGFYMYGWAASFPSPSSSSPAKMASSSTILPSRARRPTSPHRPPTLHPHPTKRRASA